MTIEEQLLGRELSGPILATIRAGEVIFIALCLIYLGGTLHDVFHSHEATSAFNLS